MTPPTVVPTPTTKIGMPRSCASAIDLATEPLHAWPSETSTNALGCRAASRARLIVGAALAGAAAARRRRRRLHLLVLVDQPQPPVDAALDVRVPGRVVFEPERRLVFEMIEEEEERVGIAREAHLRRRDGGKERQRDAIVLPLQRFAERAEKRHRPPPAIAAARRARASTPSRPAGSRDRCRWCAPSRRPRPDAPARRSTRGEREDQAEPEGEIAEDAAAARCADARRHWRCRAHLRRDRRCRRQACQIQSRAAAPAATSSGRYAGAVKRRPARSKLVGIAILSPCGSSARRGRPLRLPAARRAASARSS